MTRIGLFAGTFDPPSLGHLDVIKRAKIFCNRLIIAVAVGHPGRKSSSLFSIEERKEMLLLATRAVAHVEIESFDGLVVDFAKKKGASFLVRGLRAFSDFESESQMALANRRLSGIETLFLMATEPHTQISSTLIREIAHFGGSLKEFVPQEIEPLIRRKITRAS
ncbi:MAG: pantetheine-phosphate adenylyltransferase [Chlamydiae bacterium RIFCSPHIGHO2_12_FULL_49_9]|nr:MAG: pantetheine-phosphate adenylyltransferase [Chlamydiae bacterium RIFCSPHIGHO2_12_FULL_49_9]